MSQKTSCVYTRLLGTLKLLMHLQLLQRQQGVIFKLWFLTFLFLAAADSVVARNDYAAAAACRKIIHAHGVWKSQKSLIQHCERSELRLHFEWTKNN